MLKAIEQGRATMPQVAEAVGLNHNRVRYVLKPLQCRDKVESPSHLQEEPCSFLRSRLSTTAAHRCAELRRRIDR